MRLMRQLFSDLPHVATRCALILDEQVGKARAITSIALFVSGWLLFERVQQASASSGLWGISHLDANATAHAGVMGVLAGFTVAVIIILLTAQEPDSPDDLKVGATATFLCAFLLAVLGAFQHASFGGHGDSSESLGPSVSHDLLSGFTAYLFSILGVAFFLTVYLCFYGLVLVVAKFIPEETVRILTHSLLTLVWLLGSLWVFLDFSGITPCIGRAISFRGVALYYLSMMAIAMVWPVRFPRTSSLFIRRLLFAGLGSAVVLVSYLGVIYADHAS